MAIKRLFQIIISALGLILIVIGAIFAVQNHTQHEQAKTFAGGQFLRGQITLGASNPLPAIKAKQVIDGVTYATKSKKDASGRVSSVSVTSSADGFTYTIGGKKPAAGSCVNLLCYLSH